MASSTPTPPPQSPSWKIVPYTNKVNSCCFVCGQGVYVPKDDELEFKCPQCLTLFSVEKSLPIKFIGNSIISLLLFTSAILAIFGFGSIVFFILIVCLPFKIFYLDRTTDDGKIIIPKSIQKSWFRRYIQVVSLGLFQDSISSKVKLKLSIPPSTSSTPAPPSPPRTTDSLSPSGNIPEDDSPSLNISPPAIHSNESTDLPPPLFPTSSIVPAQEDTSPVPVPPPIDSEATDTILPPPKGPKGKSPQVSFLPVLTRARNTLNEKFAVFGTAEKILLVAILVAALVSIGLAIALSVQPATDETQSQVEKTQVWSNAALVFTLVFAFIFVLSFFYLYKSIRLVRVFVLTKMITVFQSICMLSMILMWVFVAAYSTSSVDSTPFQHGLAVCICSFLSLLTFSGLHKFLFSVSNSKLNTNWTFITTAPIVFLIYGTIAWSIYGFVESLEIGLTVCFLLLQALATAIISRIDILVFLIVFLADLIFYISFQVFRSTFSFSAFIIFILLSAFVCFLFDFAVFSVPNVSNKKYSRIRNHFNHRIGVPLVFHAGFVLGILEILIHILVVSTLITSKYSSDPNEPLAFTLFCIWCCFLLRSFLKTKLLHSNTQAFLIDIYQSKFPLFLPLGAVFSPYSYASWIITFVALYFFFRFSQVNIVLDVYQTNESSRKLLSQSYNALSNHGLAVSFVLPLCVLGFQFLIADLYKDEIEQLFFSAILSIITIIFLYAMMRMLVDRCRISFPLNINVTKSIVLSFNIFTCLFNPFVWDNAYLAIALHVMIYFMSLHTSSEFFIPKMSENLFSDVLQSDYIGGPAIAMFYSVFLPFALNIGFYFAFARDFYLVLVVSISTYILLDFGWYNVYTLRPGRCRPGFLFSFIPQCIALAYVENLHDTPLYMIISMVLPFVLAFSESLLHLFDDGVTPLTLPFNNIGKHSFWSGTGSILYAHGWFIVFTLLSVIKLGFRQSEDLAFAPATFTALVVIEVVSISLIVALSLKPGMKARFPASTEPSLFILIFKHFFPAKDLDESSDGDNEDELNEQQIENISPTVASEPPSLGHPSPIDIDTSIPPLIGGDLPPPPTPMDVSIDNSESLPPPAELSSSPLPPPPEDISHEGPSNSTPPLVNNQLDETQLRQRSRMKEMKIDDFFFSPITFLLFTLSILILSVFDLTPVYSIHSIICYLSVLFFFAFWPSINIKDDTICLKFLYRLFIGVCLLVFVAVSTAINSYGLILFRMGIIFQIIGLTMFSSTVERRLSFEIHIQGLPDSILFITNILIPYALIISSYSLFFVSGWGIFSVISFLIISFYSLYMNRILFFALLPSLFVFSFYQVVDDISYFDYLAILAVLLSLLLHVLTSPRRFVVYPWFAPFLKKQITHLLKRNGIEDSTDDREGVGWDRALISINGSTTDLEASNNHELSLKNSYLEKSLRWQEFLPHNGNLENSNDCSRVRFALAQEKWLDHFYVRHDSLEKFDSIHSFSRRSVSENVFFDVTHISNFLLWSACAWSFGTINSPILPFFVAGFILWTSFCSNSTRRFIFAPLYLSLIHLIFIGYFEDGYFVAALSYAIYGVLGISYHFLTLYSKKQLQDKTDMPALPPVSEYTLKYLLYYDPQTEFQHFQPINLLTPQILKRYREASVESIFTLNGYINGLVPQNFSFDAVLRQHDCDGFNRLVLLALSEYYSTPLLFSYNIGFWCMISIILSFSYPIIAITLISILSLLFFAKPERLFHLILFGFYILTSGILSAAYPDSVASSYDSLLGYFGFFWIGMFFYMIWKKSFYPGIWFKEIASDTQESQIPTALESFDLFGYIYMTIFVVFVIFWPVLFAQLTNGILGVIFAIVFLFIFFFYEIFGYLLAFFPIYLFVQALTLFLVGYPEATAYPTSLASIVAFCLTFILWLSTIAWTLDPYRRLMRPPDSHSMHTAPVDEDSQHSMLHKVFSSLLVQGKKVYFLTHPVENSSWLYKIPAKNHFSDFTRANLNDILFLQMCIYAFIATSLDNGILAALVSIFLFFKSLAALHLIFASIVPVLLLPLFLLLSIPSDLFGISTFHIAFLGGFWTLIGLCFVLFHLSFVKLLEKYPILMKLFQLDPNHHDLIHPKLLNHLEINSTKNVYNSDETGEFDELPPPPSSLPPSSDITQVELSSPPHSDINQVELSSPPPPLFVPDSPPVSLPTTTTATSSPDSDSDSAPVIPENTMVSIRLLDKYVFHLPFFVMLFRKKSPLPNGNLVFRYIGNQRNWQIEQFMDFFLWMGIFWMIFGGMFLSIGGVPSFGIITILLICSIIIIWTGVNSGSRYQRIFGLCLLITMLIVALTTDFQLEEQVARIVQICILIFGSVLSLIAIIYYVESQLKQNKSVVRRVVRHLNLVSLLDYLTVTHFDGNWIPVLTPRRLARSLTQSFDNADPEASEASPSTVEQDFIPPPPSDDEEDPHEHHAIDIQLDSSTSTLHRKHQHSASWDASGEIYPAMPTLEGLPEIVTPVVVAPPQVEDVPPESPPPESPPPLLTPFSSVAPEPSVAPEKPQSSIPLETPNDSTLPVTTPVVMSTDSPDHPSTGNSVTTPVSPSEEESDHDHDLEYPPLLSSAPPPGPPQENSAPLIAPLITPSIAPSTTEPKNLPPVSESSSNNVPKVPGTVASSEPESTDEDSDPVLEYGTESDDDDDDDSEQSQLFYD